jgi:hypothetical protein
MDRKRQRELALAGGAVLLLAIATWAMQRGAPQAPDANAPAGTAAATRPQPHAKSPVTEVDLQPLEAERPEPGESSRNPFRFKPKPAPPPSAAVVKQREQQAAAAAQAASAPAEPPPPPRIPLKYIGDMTDPKNPGKRIAILSDSRGTYYGGEGEVVEGRYRIVKIGVESIELAYLDGRGRQTIRQTGQ